jgi:hypothetical protein
MFGGDLENIGLFDSIVGVLESSLAIKLDLPEALKMQTAR